ncbi:2-keto-4-pentenoate hydratase [Micromonospora craniellae]|uniref:2-keto-4-pentenoate hydratase n=1 Tax=Micromonospora craniellae TaxID=2294034 RepID=A0A372FZ02_9ACTN|nr:fumarylacetoacetate hydrolase family protein [Micromonospora craniellae]QOC93410.1 fumarylacetoacetate hydrolase family protein [Micromonospora craniellae]RFS45854.1 2-keto-4-pentenoate hydratase [Micromonospora craniellae]
MTSPDKVVVRSAAERLASAIADGRPCAPVRDLIVADDTTVAVELAYRVQRRMVEQRVAAGAHLVGRKIGLTNPRVQAQLGVDQPDFGALFDDMVCPPDSTVDLGRLLQPKIEAEIAIVLGVDLVTSPRSAPISAADVVAATDHVLPALEIVDSRIAGWDIGIVDTIADNASSGLFVLGRDKVMVDSVDLAAVEMTMTSDGRVVSTGCGADCLGSPLAAVAWLANAVGDLGEPLRAGEVVLSGALGPMVPVTPGATFSADITGVGQVSVSFSGDTERRTR